VKKSTRSRVFTNELRRFKLMELSPIYLPLELEELVRLEMIAQLNQLLADTMTLRDLYKKSHWQVAGQTFYQLHLLFDKHFVEQVQLVDSIAERVQLQKKTDRPTCIYGSSEYICLRHREQ